MVTIVRLMGGLTLLAGGLFTLKPQAFRNYVEFWRPPKRTYLGGVLAILFGVVFLMAAPTCNWGGVITIIGIMAFVKGIFFLTAGRKKVKAIIDWYVAKTDKTIKILGVIEAALGILILYSI